MTEKPLHRFLLEMHGVLRLVYQGKVPSYQDNPNMNLINDAQTEQHNKVNARLLCLPMHIAVPC